MQKIFGTAGVEMLGLRYARQGHEVSGNSCKSKSFLPSAGPSPGL